MAIFRVFDIKVTLPNSLVAWAFQSKNTKKYDEILAEKLKYV